VSVVAALIVCAPAPTRAQGYESVGIRAQGMAGAFVAVADDATASWWNPAGLATSLSFADFIVEAGQGGDRGVALGFPSLGLSYYRLHISQIQPSGSTGPPGSSRQDLGAIGIGVPVLRTFELDQVGATIGQSLGSHLVVASTLKLMHASADTRADLDLGAMAAFGPVRLGLSVRNVSSPTFGTAGSADGVIDVARRARAGVAVSAPARGRLDRLTVAFDADLTKAPVDGRDERHIAGGAEAWMLGSRVGLRAGIGANLSVPTGDSGSYRAFGISVSPYQRLYLDGALTRGPGATRDRWGLDLRVTF
jgi:hypothetical protein